MPDTSKAAAVAAVEKATGQKVGDITLNDGRYTYDMLDGYVKSLKSDQEKFNFLVSKVLNVSQLNFLIGRYGIDENKVKDMV